MRMMKVVKDIHDRDSNIKIDSLARQTVVLCQKERKERVSGVKEKKESIVQEGFHFDVVVFIFY